MTGDNNRCNGVPMVMKGQLRLFRISDKGREITLYRINEGEMCILAAVCAMGNVEYDFLIEAESDSVLRILRPIYLRYFSAGAKFLRRMFLTRLRKS